MITPLIKRQSFTVTRKAGHYSTTTGQWVQDTSVVTSTTGSVQPADMDALKKLPDGDKAKRAKSIWSEFAFLMNDIVTLADGTQWEVQSIEKWTLAAVRLPHYEIVAVELEHRNGTI